MDVKTDTALSLNNLNHLPGFAAHLLKNHLATFVETQLRYATELNVPLLKFFLSLPEEQRTAVSTQSATEFLTYLAANKASEQIAVSMRQWKANQLPVIDKADIVAEDITLVNHLRKRALLDFIAGYTTDPHQIIELVKEIDLFTIQNITAATNQYLGFFKQGLEENLHFIQKVAETIPGAVYVFDATAYKGVYSNNKLPDVIGYSQAELNKLGTNAIATLIHPDDQVHLQRQLAVLRSAQGDEPLLIKYRIRKPDGTYKWLANYESVFKRKDDGSVWQTIGITLDVDSEQKALEELHQREQQLLEAQDIAQMGNYYYDLENKASVVSPKTMELLEVPPNEFAAFMENVHPDDRAGVQAALDSALTTGKFNSEYRLRGEAKTKHIWSRGTVAYRNGKAVGITGTVMDVTEHIQLLQKLAEADKRHKQAEALAHIGNYSRDLRTGAIEWSDEMRRIFEIEPGAPLQFERLLQYIHPADRQSFAATVEESVAACEPFNFYYRMVTQSGAEKIIHSRGNVELGEDGRAVRLVGTEQDVTEKQNLIRRLQNTETLYRQAEAIADMGNWSWDVPTGRLEWTDQLYRIYGLEPQSVEMTIELFLSFVHPDDKEFVTQGVERLNHENSLDYTFRIVTEDGTEKWLRSIAQVLRNDRGEITSIVGTEQNVTEKEGLINRLRESQTFIQKITDATPSIIASYNVHTGRYTFVSEGLEKLLGYEREAAMERGTAFFDAIIHPDDAAVAERQAIALRKATDSDKKETVVEFTYRLRHRNGEYRWFHTYGTAFDYNADGTVEHVLNITLDVTEQKEAAETIEEQEHFIQQIADASPTILYLFDVLSQSMAYINREAFFVLGYLPDELTETGSGVTDLLYHPDDLPLLPARAQSAKNFQQVDSMIQYECRMRHRDGDYRWLLVREIVFKADEGGGVTQIIGAALDITRRKEMERTILQNTNQLEQSNASLEEFAYVASHDLKEPLRKISTFGDRLVASHMDKLNEEGKVYLRKIVDASQRMQNMISDLLSISLISGNKGFERVSLQKVLEETLQTLEMKIEQQKAVVNYGPLPDADVVPSQFRQLFQNLIANSLKFVCEGVEPVITVESAIVGEEETAAYGVAKAPAYLKLVFSDNGIGFESEYAQKIFTIFHRLHGRSEYEGSGIGLAICKKIVEHHGGVIFASGRPGAGASFTVIIPA